MKLDRLLQGVSGRLGVLVACGLIVCSLLVLRLWYEQLRQGDDHREAISKQSLRRIRTAPSRGHILDCNGVALTQNVPSYDVYFHPHEMRRPHFTRMRRTIAHVAQQLDRIARLAGTDHDYQRSDIADMLRAKDTHIIMAGDLPRQRVLEIRNELQDVRGIEFDLGRGEIVVHPDFMWLPYQSSRDRTIEFILSRIDLVGKLVGRPHDATPEKINRHLRVSPALPYRAFEDLEENNLAQLMELMPRIPGLEINTNLTRRYTQGEIGAHLTGFVGVRYPEKKDLEEFAYYLPELTGSMGIERRFDDILKGQGGHREVRVDSVGYFYADAIEAQPAIAGDDVVLSIDMRAQRIAQSLLGDSKGAMVMLDCQTGAVLAMASAPTYDLNAVRQQFNELGKHQDRPLRDRTITADFVPGSIIKTLVALSALENEAMTANDTVHCGGGYRFDDGTYVKCANRSGHGHLGIVDAIERSCNTYFIDVGLSCGLDRLRPMFEAAGIGQQTGIELRSRWYAGRLPDRARKHQETGEPWVLYDTAATAIGQGYITLSPLQAAVFTAAIGNGGKVYEPYLVKGIMRKGRYLSQTEPRLRGRLPVKDEHLATVREGMRRVVSGEHATAPTARMAIFEIGGKTGSAQTGPRSDRRVNAWFVCFAPFDSPRYAISVMLPNRPVNNSGGRDAAPIARKFLERYLSAE